MLSQEISRLVWRFDYQQSISTQDIYSDANWAQCRRTRKSSSGGAAMWGTHCVKTWAKTQAVVARSSAESELYALVRASCEALGLHTVGEDLGVPVDSRVHIDASAAKSIAERKGLDKVRHIEVGLLWLQDQEARDRLPLHKVLGSANPADLMTNNLSQQDILKYTRVIGTEWVEGTSRAAAELHMIQAKHKVKGDSWSQSGRKGIWITHHSAYRRCPLSPMEIPCGHRNGKDLTSSRVTFGEKEDWRNLCYR